LTDRKRAAFTIAIGKPIYLEMAFALARSFKLWHSLGDIAFFLVTDAPKSALPRDLHDINLISIPPGRYGTGFESKLFLDELSPAERSLFIDADCLCVGSLATAFESFEGHAVSVVGRAISTGDWFGDIGSICRQFGISSMPRFNGGVYYLEPGPDCSEVYETARSLLPRYDEIGFRKLRGFPNDEVIVSLAMATHGLQAISERGDIMNSLLAAPGGLEIDVFAGHAVLHNPKGHPRHNPWYEMEEMRPRLVHFLGSDANAYPYRREMIRLHLVKERKWPVAIATAWAIVSYSLPWQLKEIAKDALRPLYRATFGTRAVRDSSRL
jgi:hypothetical protein